MSDSKTTKKAKKTSPSGPKLIHGQKVWVDRELCIGAATCLAVAEKAFALDSEAKAIILDTADEETTEAILDAAQACPVAAIIIEDKKGKRIYPK